MDVTADLVAILAQLDRLGRNDSVDANGDAWIDPSAEGQPFLDRLGEEMRAAATEEEVRNRPDSIE